MAEVDGGLILSILQRMQVDLAEQRQDMHETKIRLTVLDGHLAGLMVNIQLLNERSDRVGDDIRLIKRRLDLVDAI